MKKFALILSLGVVTAGCAARHVEPMLAAHKIGSIPASAISKIDKVVAQVMYTAEFESKTKDQRTKGSIRCWKDKSGRIGCTESGTVYTDRHVDTYERQISDNNYYKLEKLYQKHEKK